MKLLLVFYFFKHCSGGGPAPSNQDSYMSLIYKLYIHAHRGKNTAHHKKPSLPRAAFMAYTAHFNIISYPVGMLFPYNFLQCMLEIHWGLVLLV